MTEDEKKKQQQKPLYGGSYDEQIRDTYSQMQNRPAFSYDLDGDALYQQYKDRYTQNAKLAMKDTMGQAASLTGGYGSSYAQGVGQQRYDETMRGLTDMIPTLEQSAYQRWRDRGSDLQQQYSMLMNMGAAEQGTAQNAYSNLYALIGSTGYQPSPEELAAAGMTQEAADALRNEYLRKTGQLPAAGGSGGGGGGGGYTGGGMYYRGTGANNGNAYDPVNPDIEKLAQHIAESNPESAYQKLQNWLNSPAGQNASEAEMSRIQQAAAQAGLVDWRSTTAAKNKAKNSRP